MHLLIAGIPFGHAKALRPRQKASLKDSVENEVAGLMARPVVRRRLACQETLAWSRFRCTVSSLALPGCN